MNGVGLKSHRKGTLRQVIRKSLDMQEGWTTIEGVPSLRNTADKQESFPSGHYIPFDFIKSTQN